jgi:hypothetical protein
MTEEIKYGRRKPKNGDSFYCINSINNICYDSWGDSFQDEDMWGVGNVFLTPAAAERAMKWHRLHVALMDRAAQDWPDGYKTTEDAFVLSLNEVPETSEIDTFAISGCSLPNVPLFATYFSALKAAEEILGEDAEFYFTFDRNRNW